MGCGTSQNADQIQQGPQKKPRRKLKKVKTKSQEEDEIMKSQMESNLELDHSDDETCKYLKQLLYPTKNKQTFKQCMESLRHDQMGKDDQLIYEQLEKIFANVNQNDMQSNEIVSIELNTKF